MKRKLIESSPGLVDRLLAPAVYPAAWLLLKVRKTGLQRLPRCREALEKVGVFPIRDHYYEPQFRFDGSFDAARQRELAGIDFNVEGQLAWLAQFTHADELAGLSTARTEPPQFHFGNFAFEPGDAEVWYQVVRALKPRRIFEIGSGYSTMLALAANRRNAAEDPDFACRHVCIEPYEMPWLESSGVEVLRQRVEDVPLEFFDELSAGDVLFIDSSHVIRPEGDVLFEFLSLLPRLRSGVLVHVHDIFTPRNYPAAWLVNEVKFWNEQYVLEAFLCHNRDWEIVGALNFLRHAHYEALARVAPYLTPANGPGSFYLRRR